MNGHTHRVLASLVAGAVLTLLSSSARSDVAADPRDQALLDACGSSTSTLHRVASQVAVRSLHRRRPRTMLSLGRQLRVLGEPHPGARAWALRGSRVDRRHAAQRLRRWLADHDPGVPRRCGVASVQDSEHGEAVAVVAVAVFAELRHAIPTAVRPGRWVTVDARMIERARSAKVVVLGPRGAPRTIPTSFDRRRQRVVGRFMADQPGDWLVQVLASIRGGPRPVLEAALRVGDEDGPRASIVPGEGAGQELPDADAMFAKLQAARSYERLPTLARDEVLDEVADRHVRQMMQAGRVAHDVGDGTPPQRVDAAGLSSSEVGENVSRAQTTTLAHRALWASPSHRANTLHPRYVRVGVAARRDAQGKVWVAQVFAGPEIGAR